MTNEKSNATPKELQSFEVRMTSMLDEFGVSPEDVDREVAVAKAMLERGPSAVGVMLSNCHMVLEYGGFDATAAALLQTLKIFRVEWDAAEDAR